MAVTPKLSLVLPDFGGGGAERIMVTLANAFAARGFDTTMIAGQAKGPCLADLSAGVRLLDLDVPRFGRAIPALVRHFRTDRPDAVLSALTHANLATLVAARLARGAPRIVVAEHNSITMMLASGSRAKRAAKRALARLLYPRAACVTFVSRAMQDEFAAALALPADRRRTIYNPLPLGHLRDMAATPPRHPWLRDRTTPVLVAAGRLAPQKDFPTLLRAFALLAQTSPARLVIFGEGPDRPALQAQVNDLGLGARVSLPGFVPSLPVELAAADLFVLSSRWEGLPGVLLESLAVGTPVVATDCPTGPDEILEQGRWGRLVPVGDAPALAEAIRESLARPLPPASDAMLARFDTDHIIDQYLSVLLPPSPATGPSRLAGADI
nr:glycosyltransferase [Gemmobacter straminiformis]